MKCTHCGTPLVFRTGKKYTTQMGKKTMRLICPKCKELFLAIDGLYSHPFQTHPQRLDSDDVKKVRTLRASNNEMRLIEQGKLTLTVSGDAFIITPL